MRVIATAMLMVALLLMGLAFLTPADSATVHRCTDADGVVTFSDLPCPPVDDQCDEPEPEPDPTAEPEPEPESTADTATVDAADSERRRRIEASW